MKTLDTTKLKQLLPEDVRELCRRLSEQGFRAWVVGGCVRDTLLAALRDEISPSEQSAAYNDWDVATDARPEQVQKCFRRVVPTGLKHGTVTVLIRGTGYEVTTLRGETTYSDGRHPDSVYFVDDIVADLARRDFTINAIAYDPLSDELTDPFGGVSDLTSGTLHAVGNPSERFAEDGLRVLRATRFAATLQFEIAPETAAAIAPSLDSYRRVSSERIRDEWVKALKARQPSRAFELMRIHDLLAVTAPELLESVGSPPQSDTQDVWRHSLRCLDACAPDPVLRLAALLHELVSAELADALLRRLRFSNRDRERVVALITHYRIDYDPSWDAAAVRRWVQRVTPDLIEDLVALARADLLTADGQAAHLDQLRQRAEQALADGMPLSTRDLTIDGNDLMRELGLAPGARIGELLQQLLDEAVTDPSRNQRDTLLARAKQLLSE